MEKLSDTSSKISCDNYFTQTNEAKMFKPSSAILIIEDEIELITLYYEQAADIFGQVYVATTLTEAKKILKEKHIDGVLLDDYLPDGRGLSLLETLSSKEYNCPALIITAVTSIANIQRIIGKSVFKFMYKPVHLKELQATLLSFKEYIEKNRQAVELKSKTEVTKFALERVSKQYGLTIRETDVIEHSIRTKNNTDLAHQLFISHGTIKRHWQNIFNKTNLRSKEEIIDLIAKHNITSYHHHQAL